MPASIVRLSAGRLSLTDEAQALCFLAGANSVFLGDRLLTTPNPGATPRRAVAGSARHAADGQRIRPDGAGACGRIARSNAACPRTSRDWEQDGLLRTLRSPAGIDLSSNDYLALAHDSRLVRRISRSRRPRRRAAARDRGCCAASATLRRGRATVRALQGHRAGAVFLERLPREPRGADHVDRAGRRDLLGRAQSRQPDRRRPAVAAAPCCLSAQRRRTPDERPRAGAVRRHPLRRRRIAVQHGRRLRAARADSQTSAGRPARC